MLSRFLIFKITFLIILSCLLIDCGAPYKIMPGYEKQKNDLNTIALYPVYYTDDGRDEKKFSTYFNNRFFDALIAMTCKRPVHFVPTNLTMRIFQEADAGSWGENSGDGTIDSIISGFPRSRMPSDAKIKAVADKIDGIIFCELIEYDQPGTGKSASNQLTTSTLTYGMESASDRHRFTMQITLYSTLNGSIIWKYKQQFGKPLADARSTREAYTNRIIEDFIRYFPLSDEFKGKE